MTRQMEGRGPVTLEAFEELRRLRAQERHDLLNDVAARAVDLAADHLQLVLDQDPRRSFGASSDEQQRLPCLCTYPCSDAHTHQAGSTSDRGSITFSSGRIC